MHLYRHLNREADLSSAPAVLSDLWPCVTDAASALELDPLQVTEDEWDIP